MGGPGAGHKSKRAQEARQINIQKARAARRREPLPWRSGVESRVIEQLVWQWWMQKKAAAGEGERGGERSFATQGKTVEIVPQTRAFMHQGKPFVPGSRQFARRAVSQGRAFDAPGKRAAWMIPAPWQPASLSQKTGTSKAGATGSASYLCQGLDRSIGAIESRQTVKPGPAYRLARVLGVSHTWVNKLVKRFERNPEKARRRNGAFAPATMATLERAREETRWQREHGRLRGPMPRRRKARPAFVH